MAVNPPSVSFVLTFAIGKYAFSERHYLVQATTVNAAGAGALAFGYASQRCQLLGSGCTLIAIEMHDAKNLRSTTQIAIPAQPAAGLCYNPAFNPVGGVSPFPGPEGNVADFAYADLLCRKEANVPGDGNVYHSGYYIACNPDAAQEQDIFPPNNAIWRPAFDALRTFAYAPPGGAPNNYGMKVLDRSAVDSPSYNVVGVSVNANSQFVYVINGTPAWAAGTQVTIKGIKGLTPSQVNGIRFITTFTPPSTFVVNFPLAPAGWVYKGGGTVQQRTFSVIPYSNLIMDKWTHHKRGDSLFGVRGRRFAHRSTST